MIKRGVLAVLSVLSVGVLAALAGEPVPITLSVDATQFPRAQVSARETLPIAPSAHAQIVTLVYPQWLPGDHSPTGPITDLVNIRFVLPGSGTVLHWTRDPLDMYAFRIEVPAAAALIEADFTSVGQYSQGDDFSIGNTATATQGDLLWNQVVLYPAGARSDQVLVKASVVLPPGWQFATAMPSPQRAGDSVSFAGTSLTTLVDSPLMMGSHFREFDVTPAAEPIKHYLDVFGESEQDLALTPERVGAVRKLVEQTGVLFRSRHYGSYHFLVEAQGSDHEDGLEHHESSDNHVAALGMVDPNNVILSGTLLSHEMTHSWNGKYRRPAGLATKNYQDPMDGQLLWVYEGMTSYWEDVLAARSGLESAAQAREHLAYEFASIAGRTGRDWRPLQDTATAAQLLYPAPRSWRELRRSTDYYQEGPLLWLEADCLIRARSGGARSLDSFAGSFYGGPSGAPALRPYQRADLIAALNQTQPFDWAAFFDTRVGQVRAADDARHAVEACGWRLVYNAEPNEVVQDSKSLFHEDDLRDSLGLMTDEEGEVIDVRPDLPAGRAGLVPQSKLVGVNHHGYSSEVLHQAVRDAQGSAEPIELTVSRKGVLEQLRIDYHGGERYAHLERLPGSADLLGAILTPRAALP
jgi:predicted metalloprotease with PDZ domain